MNDATHTFRTNLSANYDPFETEIVVEYVAAGYGVELHSVAHDGGLHDILPDLPQWVIGEIENAAMGDLRNRPSEADALADKGDAKAHEVLEGER